MFPDEAAARDWFEETRWPDEVWCPHCSGIDTYATRSTRPAHRFRCRDCKRHFSAKADTVMGHSHLPYRTWAFAFYLAATNLKGVSSMKLGRDLGVTQKTAWMLAHKVRQGDRLGTHAFRVLQRVGDLAHSASGQPQRRRADFGRYLGTHTLGVLQRDASIFVKRVVSQAAPSTYRCLSKRVHV